MTTTIRSLVHATATLAVALPMSLWICAASAQTVLDSPELYPGEKALYESAKKEGMPHPRLIFVNYPSTEAQTQANSTVPEIRM